MKLYEVTPEDPDRTVDTTFHASKAEANWAVEYHEQNGTTATIRSVNPIQRLVEYQVEIDKLTDALQWVLRWYINYYPDICTPPMNADHHRVVEGILSGEDAWMVDHMVKNEGDY